MFGQEEELQNEIADLKKRIAKGIIKALLHGFIAGTVSHF